MNRFPKIKKTLEILFVCFIGYWIISFIIEEDNFEKLSPEVAQELETKLLGNWARATDEGMMLLQFGKNSMSFSNFGTGPSDRMEVDVIYHKLDEGWGIDLVSTFRGTEGQMMVFYENQTTILYGAPGLPFVEFFRETKTEN